MVDIDKVIINGWTRYYIRETFIPHREDGPATISPSNNLEYWYLNGQYVNCTSQKEFEKSELYRIWKLRVFT